MHSELHNSHLLPTHRRLQIFSLDPSADIKLETALISRSVVNIPWEELSPGPVGEYVEVVDYDPSSDCAYDPVNLSRFLAMDGLSPSTGNPQFHQQMVYAVAMMTIKNFERVLGRKILWSERRKDENGQYIKSFSQRYVRRLRLYPHALREQNAYYSPAKKSLLFGYFNAPTNDPRNELPGGLVFTCLSHDITAHETTHAILDGIHRRLLDASNPDMLAFHEAFADIVAIFQHFTLPGLLLDQIQKTRGNLNRDNLLARLASQFARSTGRGDALRNALGEVDSHGHRQEPDPTAFGRTFEPHARGAILVAAVFDAFLRIYESSVADLRRIATEGTGILREGEIHPDLAKRFAQEAVKAANRVLTICIRAVDYLPPVDITFGDYLRALITADADLIPDDPRRYRLAFIEAFRDRGIYPLDVRTLAEDTLCWSKPTAEDVEGFRAYLPPANVLRTMAFAYGADPNFAADFLDEERGMFRHLDDLDFDGAASAFLSATWLSSNSGGAEPSGDKDERYSRFLLDKVFAMFLQRWITRTAATEQRVDMSAVEWWLGIDIKQLADGTGRLEVHAVRPTLRIGPDGQSKIELLVLLTQKRNVPLIDENGQPITDAAGNALTFKQRGGCTLIIDPEKARVRVSYAISKNLCSQRRVERHAAFLRQEFSQHEEAAVERYGLTDQAAAVREQLEPLAIVHGEPKSGGGY